MALVTVGIIQVAWAADDLQQYLFLLCQDLLPPITLPIYFSDNTDFVLYKITYHTILCLHLYQLFSLLPRKPQSPQLLPLSLTQKAVW